MATPFQGTAASSGAESLALTAGGIAALFSGACCVAPLLLVSAGLGGAALLIAMLAFPYLAPLLF